MSKDFLPSQEKTRCGNDLGNVLHKPARYCQDCVDTAIQVSTQDLRNKIANLEEKLKIERQERQDLLRRIDLDFTSDTAPATS